MIKVDKCFDVMSKSVADSCAEFGDSWRINTEKYNILREYCDAFDKVFDEFEAESFDAKVLPDKHILITFNCMDICIDGVNHPFFGLIERAETVNISHVSSDEMKIDFVFPSVWDKIG